MKKKIKINFTGFWHQNTPESIRVHNPLFIILSKRFDLELSNNPDFLIYSNFVSNFEYDYLKYNCIRVFYTGENVRPDFSECDYAFSFDYPVTEKNFRLPLYGLYSQLSRLKEEKNINSIIQLKTGFCNFIYSNERAKERIEFFQKLNGYKRVDSGGKVLNNIGYQVEDKMKFIENYKFTIAFENESYHGYTSEKILQAMTAHTIPIYWGNPLIALDFNTKAFINCHDYKDFDAVIEKVKEIDCNDDLYRSYLTEPCFENGEDNEFINEERILDRFEHIFVNKDIKRAARKMDFVKRALLRMRLKLGLSDK